ncbi:MAG TPA: hypothetical protein DCQ58_03795, partial [Saprospirales bacterium]|nr:hypothetical protein [Saprospirales bacterium]
MKKYTLIIFFFCLGINFPEAQKPPITVDTPANDLYVKAQKLHQSGQYTKAKNAYRQILKKYPEHINSCLGLAGIYYLEEDWITCQNMLELAVKIDSFANTEMYFSLGLVFENLEQYRNAIAQFRIYYRMEKLNVTKLNKAESKIERLEFIVDKLENPVPFMPVDPGEQINSSASEYWASTDITGNLLVFTRRVNGQEDLFVSNRIDGVWQTAQAITELNTPANEGAHCLSADGKTLIFTICDRKDSYGSCDLYFSRFRNGQWTPAVSMGPRINSATWDGQPSLSADGQTLYFVSTRLGSVGGKDIWLSRKGENNLWTVPENAGSMINTTGDEEAPYIHSDNKTLYFSSTGHLGMGGRDLFLSEKSENGWSEPLNLGYPVNTSADEGTLIVNPDGKSAFFSSDRVDLEINGDKKLNIYGFELHDRVRAQPVSYAKGFVFDANSHKPVIASISLFDNASGILIQKIQTGEEGDFLLILPNGKNYNLTVMQEGYLFHSENFSLTAQHTASKPHQLDIYLDPITSKVEISGLKPEKSTVLKNVFFEFGSAKLDMSLSGLELNNLVHFLREHPDIRIEISGHT